MNNNVLQVIFREFQADIETIHLRETDFNCSLPEAASAV